MSARPRPVTATIKPTGMQPVTGVRTRSYSLSSGASTESLVSVLGHESYESPGESDQEEGDRHQETTTQDATFDKPRRRPPTRKPRVPLSSMSSDKSRSPSPPKDSNINSWEQWMIRKAKQARRKEKRELLRQQKLKEEEEKKQKEKEEKLQQGEGKIKEWIEKKNLVASLEKKRNTRQERVKEDAEKEKTRQITEKAQQKYTEWLEQKNNKEREQLRLKKEKEKKEAEDKKKRQEECQTEFEKWCKKAQQRPKSAHSSLGYTSGKLTGYHDMGSYPTPSFVNPLPWKPIEVPNPKPQKKRPKTARRWNPDKYF